MATRYVWSGASGTADGSSFANAHLTLTAAITASTAGDTFLVASDHSETQASALTLGFKGTAAAPDYIISVDRTTTVPTPGALVATTGASNLAVTGSWIANGVYFSGGDSTNVSVITFGAAATRNILRNSFIATTATSGSRVSTTGALAELTFDNVSIVSRIGGANLMRVSGGATLRWINSTPYVTSGGGFTGGVIPTNFIDNSISGTALIANCDLSAYTSSKTLVQITAGTMWSVRFLNCTIIANVTIAVPTSRTQLIELLGCSAAGGGAVRHERYTMAGSTVLERTIVRTGGASDGIDNISLKLASGASAAKLQPVDSQEIVVNFTSADVGVAKTLTVHVVTDNVTLTSAEAWLEGSYLATSGVNQATFITQGPTSVLDTGSAQTTDTATWTTTGLTTPVKQKLVLTVTPQRAGDGRFVVRLAKASTTMYVCPKIDVT